MYSKQSEEILTQYQYYRVWLYVGFLMVGIVVYFSLIPHPPKLTGIPGFDKFEHLAAYAGLMGWFSQLYLSRQSRVVLAVIFCLMGISLEIVQGWMGHRYFEYADMLANTTGVFIGWWLSAYWCSGWLARIDKNLAR